MISGVDNTWKNMYIAFKSVDGSYRTVVCPWDCDLSWGMNWSESTSLHWSKDLDYLVSYDITGNLCSRYVSLIDGAKEELQKKWNSLRSGILSEESLYSRVDELNSVIRDSGAYHRDEVRWPEGGHTKDTGCEYIKSFITQRLAFLDEYVAGL